MIRLVSGLAAATLVVLCAACGPGDDSGDQKPRSFKFLSGMEGRIEALRGEDGTWLRGFLAGGGTLSEEMNLRRMSDILGRMMRSDDSDKIATFVREAKERLYAEYFYSFGDEERMALVRALRDQCGPGSVQAEKYAAVLGPSEGIFEATLNLMLRSVSLREVARPPKMSRERIESLARASGTHEVLAGAAEVLVAGSLVAGEGEQERKADLFCARELMTDAHNLKPDDVATRMAYVMLHFGADIGMSDLKRICEAGGSFETDNAAYPYLIALTLLDRGKDEEAIQAVQKGLAMPYASFHDVERARAVAAFLEVAGLGAVGARLSAYSDASVEGSMRLRELSKRLRQAPDAMRIVPPLVVTFSRRLSEQIDARPRMLTTEVIRLSMLLSSWEWALHEAPDADGAKKARAELELLEAGRARASGPHIWDDLFRIVGEKGFLRYSDEVLFGGEPAYLRKCAGKDSLEACAELLK
jgi:hypothetical protein